MKTLLKTEIFDELCLKGLKEKFGKKIPNKIMKRYKLEKSLILDLQWADLLIHHQKIINLAKEKNITLGIFRGSPNSSLICYALNLTNVNPVKYNMPYARFLECRYGIYPVLPIDVKPEQKDELIKIIMDFYGKENVVIDKNPDDPLLLEGKFLDETHVFVSDKPVDNITSSSKLIIKSNKMHLKFIIHSFVGLDSIKGYEKFNEIPCDNKEVYSLINQRKAGYSFVPCELNDFGKKLLEEIHPQTIEEITAFYALDREITAKSGLADEYVKAKNLKNTRYDCAQLKPILKETYGTIIYQEQIVQILNLLGGFSIEDAEIIRRCMAKNKKTNAKETFIENAQNIIDTQKAQKLWDKMSTFSRSCFMKAHAISYAQILYFETYRKIYQ